MGPTESPLITYFSFIILGLMMCFGYLFLRLIGQKKTRDEKEKRRLEDELRDAEIEARRISSNKPGETGDVLALPPDVERKLARIKDLADARENLPDLPDAVPPGHPAKDNSNKREMGS